MSLRGIGIATVRNGTALLPYAIDSYDVPNDIGKKKEKKKKEKNIVQRDKLRHGKNNIEKGKGDEERGTTHHRHYQRMSSHLVRNGKGEVHKGVPPTIAQKQIDEHGKGRKRKDEPRPAIAPRTFEGFPMSRDGNLVGGEIEPQRHPHIEGGEKGREKIDKFIPHVAPPTLSVLFADS